MTVEKQTTLKDTKEKFPTERLRDTCELLGVLDEYGYEAHAAHFFRRAIIEAEPSKDAHAWDRIHLEMGGHAAAVDNRALLHRCFDELNGSVAKWRLFETSLHFPETFFPTEDIIALGELRASAEIQQEYGTLAGIEQVFLEINQNSMTLQELKTKACEIEMFTQQARHANQPVDYFESWHEPVESERPRIHAPINVADIAAHVGRDNLKTARHCYEILVGGGDFYIAANSDPEKNLQAALYLARYDRGSVEMDIVNTEIDYSREREKILTTLSQNVEPQEKDIDLFVATGIFTAEQGPWSLDRVHRLVETAETLDEGEIYSYEIQKKLQETWKMISATTDPGSPQRQQAFEEISFLAGANFRLGSMTAIEDTRRWLNRY